MKTAVYKTTQLQFGTFEVAADEEDQISSMYLLAHDVNWVHLEIHNIAPTVIIDLTPLLHITCGILCRMITT